MVEVALGAVCEASVGVGERVFAIEPNRLAVRRDGGVEVAFGTIGVAAAGVGGGVSGIGPGRVAGLGSAIGAALQNAFDVLTTGDLRVGRLEAVLHFALADGSACQSKCIPQICSAAPRRVGKGVPAIRPCVFLFASQ